MSAFPSGNQPPRNPHSSCTPQPAELPEERGGPSQRCAPSVSFSAPLDDRMSIAASEGESDFSGDDSSAPGNDRIQKHTSRMSSLLDLLDY